MRYTVNQSTHTYEMSVINIGFNKQTNINKRQCTACGWGHFCA